MVRFAALVPLASLVLAGAPALAQPIAQAKPDVVLPSVSATAVRDPVDKSYRKMIHGMEVFEQNRSRAPSATLRYKLLPRLPGTNMSGISVDVVGETVATAVSVGRDQTFTLERDPKALAEDASVIPNRPAGSMTWRTEIRSPGLPPATRRLGDLRLECLVGMEAGLVSNVKPIFGQLANLFVGPADYCGRVDSQYLYFAERPLFAVTLVHAERRETLSIDRMYAGASYDTGLKSDLPYCDCQALIDRTYFLPLGDRSWPDDTLVQYEYMDDAKGAGT